jgi:DNA-binding LacI/PurR family transcriptional regulator
MGRKGVEQLLTIGDDTNITPTQSIILQPELIVRESTDPLS